MKRATIGYLGALDYSGSEALNTICSNLTFSGRDQKKILFTSCTAGEGKSYLCMHIVYNLAKRGKRVVVVDADLRRSFLVNRYSIETTEEWRGLAHYLAGYAELDQVLYETNWNGVCIIPAGKDIANPIPLLNSPYFSELLNTLTAHFDLVIVDAPPIGLVIDAAEIAQACDSAVFVIEYNKTRRRSVMEAKKQLTQASCPILGCIVNKVTFNTLSAKKYYNKHYYAHYYNTYYRKAPNRRGQLDEGQS